MKITKQEIEILGGLAKRLREQQGLPKSASDKGIRHVLLLTVGRGALLASDIIEATQRKTVNTGKLLELEGEGLINATPQKEFVYKPCNEYRITNKGLKVYENLEKYIKQELALAN